MRPAMNSQANADEPANWVVGFQAARAEWNTANEPLLPSHSSKPGSPTHIPKTATPTATASQLNFQRISAMVGRTTTISHAPKRVLARYIQYRPASPQNSWQKVSPRKTANGTTRAARGDCANRGPIRFIVCRQARGGAEQAAHLPVKNGKTSNEPAPC